MRTLGRAARRVDAVHRRLRDQRPAASAGLPALPDLALAADNDGDDAADRVAAPRRPLRREARDARHQRRRPGRRRRPDQGGRGPHPRRPRDDPLRAAAPRATAASSAINELPDLAERIQVALFNVLEERDIQVRGYALRLPLDVLVVASANPEDYTNRGRIITPLKDRFGAEVRTHYPLDVDDEVALISQEAGLVADVPDAPARGRRPAGRRSCATRPRSTSAPASRPGSPSRRSRRRRRPRCDAAR